MAVKPKGYALVYSDYNLGMVREIAKGYKTKGYRVKVTVKSPYTSWASYNLYVKKTASKNPRDSRLNTAEKWWNTVRYRYWKKLGVKNVEYSKLSREEKDRAYRYFSQGKNPFHLLNPLLATAGTALLTGLGFGAGVMGAKMLLGNSRKKLLNPIKATPKQLTEFARYWDSLNYAERKAMTDIYWREPKVEIEEMLHWSAAKFARVKPHHWDFLARTRLPNPIDEIAYRRELIAKIRQAIKGTRIIFEPQWLKTEQLEQLWRRISK